MIALMSIEKPGYIFTNNFQIYYFVEAILAAKLLPDDLILLFHSVHLKPIFFNRLGHLLWLFLPVAQLQVEDVRLPVSSSHIAHHDEHPIIIANFEARFEMVQPFVYLLVLCVLKLQLDIFRQLPPPKIFRDEGFDLPMMMAVVYGF